MTFKKTGLNLYFVLLHSEMRSRAAAQHKKKILLYSPCTDFAPKSIIK